MTKLLLIASCWGYCCNPDCRKPVLYESQGDIFWIWEHAHIYAYELDGPRWHANSMHDNNFENLIVLCPSCHTLVDKNPNIYSVHLLLGWKRIRKEFIEKGINLTFSEITNIPYTSSIQYRYEQIIYSWDFIRENEASLILDTLKESYEMILEKIRSPTLIQIIPDEAIDEKILEKIILTLLINLQQEINDIIYFVRGDNYREIINDISSRKEHWKIIFISDLLCLDAFIPLPWNPDFQSKIIFISNQSYAWAVKIPIAKQHITSFIPLYDQNHFKPNPAMDSSR